jgi:hypothetical protein
MNVLYTENSDLMRFVSTSFLLLSCADRPCSLIAERLLNLATTRIIGDRRLTLLQSIALSLEDYGNLERLRYVRLLQLILPL